jgi:hypothetical protein
MKPLVTVFIAIAAFLWAKLEIHIEGQRGWAADLPTWRVEKHRLLDLLYGGRPLTGYHVWCFAFMFFFFHMPLFWTGSWSIGQELNVIGGFFLFWVAEDFLWFVLNPHFGLRKFTKEHAWWHKRWLAWVPVDYWAFGLLGVLFLYFF